MNGLAKALSRLGFPEPVELGDLRSIAHIFGARKRRTGVYALVLPGERVYIGKATDVVRRFAQHRLAHEAIEAFTFMPVRAEDMDLHERTLITDAEDAGLHLTNIDHMRTIRGERDLDGVIAPEQQERWLLDPYAVNQVEARSVPIQALPRAQVARFADRLVRLRARRSGEAAVKLLTAYVRGCVPFPRQTEYSFWSVSCLPTTGGRGYPRIVVLNAAVMELYVLFGERDPDVDGVWGFVNVAADGWASEFDRPRAFQREFPDVEVREAQYRSAGCDVLQLWAYGDDEHAALLADTRVQRAAGVLALRLMRRRATIFSKYHCKPLADAALEWEAKPSRPDTVSGALDPEAVLRALIPQSYWVSVLRVLAASIETSHRSNPDRWGIRLSESSIMLMVGPHEVLQLGPWEPPFHIVFDRDTAPSELRAVRGALFSEDRDYEGRIGAAGFYKSNPGTEACRIPIRFVGSTYRMLQQSHTAVIERAALMARNPMTRRTHSPALVRFIAQETGERLFQPSYVEV